MKNDGRSGAHVLLVLSGVECSNDGGKEKRRQGVLGRQLVVFLSRAVQCSPVHGRTNIVVLMLLLLLSSSSFVSGINVVKQPRV